MGARDQGFTVPLWRQELSDFRESPRAQRTRMARNLESLGCVALPPSRADRLQRKRHPGLSFVAVAYAILCTSKRGLFGGRAYAFWPRLHGCGDSSAKTRPA